MKLLLTILLFLASWGAVAECVPSDDAEVEYRAYVRPIGAYWLQGDDFEDIRCAVAEAQVMIEMLGGIAEWRIMFVEDGVESEMPVDFGERQPAIYNTR